MTDHPSTPASDSDATDAAPTDEASGAVPAAAAPPAITPPKRRFPWIPVLAVLAGLQLIGIGVLAVILVATSVAIVDRDETITELTTTLEDVTETLEQVAGERDQARQELTATAGQFETALDYATVYEECLVPLFQAYDAYDAGDLEEGDDLFEQSWAEDGPCWTATEYLTSE